MSKTFICGKCGHDATVPSDAPEQPCGLCEGMMRKPVIHLEAILGQGAACGLRAVDRMVFLNPEIGKVTCEACSTIAAMRTLHGLDAKDASMRAGAFPGKIIDADPAKATLVVMVPEGTSDEVIRRCEGVASSEWPGKVIVLAHGYSVKALPQGGVYHRCTLPDGTELEIVAESESALYARLEAFGVNRNQPAFGPSPLPKAIETIGRAEKIVAKAAAMMLAELPLAKAKPTTDAADTPHVIPRKDH